MDKALLTKASYDSSILELAKKHDLVLLDIDDVVITPLQYFCGSIWYKRYHTLQKDKLLPTEIVSTFYKCLNATAYTPVANQLINEFSALSEKQIVLGFTARDFTLVPSTQYQIEKIGMKFSQLNSSYPLMHKGIIYSGVNPNTAIPNNKGKILLDFIENQVDGEINSILFIDDTRRNLEEVQQALGGKIGFSGIHYTEVNTKLFCDYKQDELDALGEYQFNSFSKYRVIPSDNEFFTCNILGENFLIME